MQATADERPSTHVHGLGVVVMDHEMFQILGACGGVGVGAFDGYVGGGGRTGGGRDHVEFTGRSVGVVERLAVLSEP